MMREGTGVIDLEKVATDLKGIDTEISVTIGIPHRVLSKITEEENIDLVVIATHGRKRLAHALLGSVTERLVRASACPVLTVHPGD